MERWMDFVLVFGGLYAIYFFTLRRWDYTSEAKRKADKDSLKKKGLSNAYYFSGAGKLFAYLLITGGVYVFYWLYKQWKAIAKGYLNSTQTPLKGGPVLRAACGLVTFYQLAGIMNRTCKYMRKPPAAAAWFSGSLWLVSLAGIIALPSWYKLAALAVFCAIPARLQSRVNALTGKEVPNQFKTSDILPLVITLSAGIWLWLAVVWKIAFISFK